MFTEQACCSKLLVDVANSKMRKLFITCRKLQMLLCNTNADTCSLYIRRILHGIRVNNCCMPSVCPSASQALHRLYIWQGLSYTHAQNMPRSTCKYDCENEDEQQVLTGLPNFEPAAALLAPTRARGPPTAHVHEYDQRTKKKRLHLSALISREAQQCTRLPGMI